MILAADVYIPFVLILAAPSFAFLMLRYLARRSRSDHMRRNAVSWPSAQAVVNSSFEMNTRSENIADKGNDPEYVHYWVTAIQYAYKVNGEFYAGTYFLPRIYKDSGVATDAGRFWIDKKIVIRYQPSNPNQLCFLESDGAPGKPYIPTRADRPAFTTLSLK